VRNHFAFLKSIKLSSFQQAARIRLKHNALKIGNFNEILATGLGAGGRAFKSPAPTNKTKHLRFQSERSAQRLAWCSSRNSTRLANRTRAKNH